MKILRRLCILFLIIGIWSCDTENIFIGAGTAPDISAPELIIKTPANLSYESGDFVMSGVAFDNLKVTKVDLKIYCNGVRVSDLENPPVAAITGDKWSYNFKNLQSGEYTITATAHDRAGNTSEKSSKSIVVTVDNEPSKVAIQKPSLKPQLTLEGLDYRDYTYIEYFQNKTFSIRGSIEDEYPLKEITLQLFKDTECVYSLTFDSKYLGEKRAASMVEGSLYNWLVTVNSTEEPSQSESYTNKLALLSATEKHYLKVGVIVTDKAGNKTMDTNTDLGFICLYQDADRPWIEVSSLMNEETLELQQEKNKLRAGAQISGTAYDDDLLDTMEFRIVNTDYDEVVKEEVISKTSFGDTGCTVWSLIAPTNQGRYRLYYRLKDNHGTKSYDDKDTEWTKKNGWNAAESIGFQVIDESAPMTEIAAFEEYPATAYAENESPAFVIDAVTRDAVGISQVILAWTADIDEKKIDALKRNKWNITTDGYKDGIKYWVVDLSNFENVSENTTYKMEWSCELPVSDFVAEDASAIYNYKKMYYCTVSKSGNYSVGTFTIPKEFNEPELSIDSPKDNDTVRNVAGEYFIIEGKCSDVQSGIASLTIEYKKSNGEPAVFDVLGNGLLAADGTWSVTSNKLTELGGSYQRIVAKATDNFGNISQSSVYVKVDDNSPQVVSVGIDEGSGYYSVGSILHFRVTMNREIEIKGDKESIYLELNCKEGYANVAKAKFDGFEEEKILKFKYTVEAGDKAEPLDYLAIDSIKMDSDTFIIGKAQGEGISSVPAVLKLIEPGNSGSLSSRGVFIDTERPRIAQISTNVGQGAYTVGKEIRIFTQINEVVSGKAKILVNSRPNDPTREELFVKMENSVVKSDTLEFVYTVEEGDNNKDGESLDIYVPIYAEKYNPTTYNDVETVKDVAGNEMNFEEFPIGAISGSLASLGIKIDTTAPTLKNVYVESVSEDANIVGSKYYLNAGKTVTLIAEFSELMILGNRQPTLCLNALNGAKTVEAQYKSGAGSSQLRFVYTVAANDNSNPNEVLTCKSFVGDVTDEAGNKISGSVNDTVVLNNEIVLKKSVINEDEKAINGSTSYIECSIVVDTTKPEPPVFTFNDNKGEINDFTESEGRATGRVYTGRTNGYTNNITVTVSPVDGETTSTATMFATVGGQAKVNWNEQNVYTTDTNNAEEDWTVKAQLKDYAGNNSDVTLASFKIDNGLPLLSSINTTSVSGLYKAGTEINVTLIFSKRVNIKKSGTDDIVLTFNNGGRVVFNKSNTYSAMHKGTYTVGIGDTDISKLEVASITGGNFCDTAGNIVAVIDNDYKLALSNGFADDFCAKNIQIDKTNPELSKYTIESISDETHSDDNAYYLNAGKTMKIAVTFKEQVMISGDSKIALSHGKKASYIGTSSDRKTLYYTYSVVNGENCSDFFGIKAGVIPNNITDIAGNGLIAGLTEAAELKYKNKNIVIDTVTPVAPTVTLKKGNGNVLSQGDINNGVSEQLQMIVSGEDGATIEYSTNGGAKYDIGTTAVLGSNGIEKIFYIVAKQTDKAGNMSKMSDKITIKINMKNMGISKITTTKVDGTYKAADKIPITLLFTQKVKFDNLQLTLSNGKVLKFEDSDTFAISHQADYTIAVGDDTEADKYLNVSNISGNFVDESNAGVTDKISASFEKLADNFTGNKILIDTKAPQVSGYSVANISDTEHMTNSWYYLNADDTVTIRVQFNEKVTVVGTSVLPLNSGENAVYSSTVDDTTLLYTYKVVNGNAENLTVEANVYPTNIQDAAGNALSSGVQAGTVFSLDDKNIKIDTENPEAPKLVLGGDLFLESKYSAVAITSFEISKGEEVGGFAEYSLDAGGSYTRYTGSVSLPETDDKGFHSYNILLRQTDNAGNMSPVSQLQNIVVDLRPTGLKKISTTKPGGVYKAAAVIPLTIEFYKAITSDENITLTLSNNAKVKFKANRKSVYIVDYVVEAEDENTEELTVKSISGNIKDTLTNDTVSSFEGVDGLISNGFVEGNITAENLPTDDEHVIAIDTIAPTISSYSVRNISDTEHVNGKYYLNAGDTVEISAVFNEKVTIGGESAVKLNNGKKATYIGTSDDKKTLYYTYTVSGGDDKTDLGIAIGVYPNNVLDIGGNALSSGLANETTLKFENKGIVIDTVCVAPTLNGISAGSIYNASQNVILSGESGAAFHYSVDGGASENAGNEFSTPSTEGRHPITAYQVDIAGNKSLWANVIEIIVDTAPPTIKSISTTAGDGTYKAGDTLTITAEFSEDVTGNIIVALTSDASVTFDVNGRNATATYKVAAEQNTTKLAVSSITGNIKDIADNSLVSFTGYGNFVEKYIKIDTTEPNVIGFSMTEHSSSKKLSGELSAQEPLKNAATDSNIILNFDEGVSKGSGSIKIERVYKSYPAVMEVDDYNTHKASISSWYIQRCIGTVNNGTEPDTNAKYVLKYDIDHGAYETNGSLNGDQKAVYDYFADKEYNVTTIDVNSGLVAIGKNSSDNTDSVVTIKLPSKLQKGIIYKVTFTAGTFTDTVGNKCAALSGNTVYFETGPTATPVIRINKISGSGSGNQPYTTGVKISSEMYGAKLYYGKTSNKVTCDNNKPSKVADPDPTSFSEYSGAITISTASSALGEIFKLWAKTTKDGLTAGEVCKELAFKTVIGLGGSSHYVRGSDSTGGVSATTEFPASWYDSLSTAQGGSSCWVTWHILKSFQWKEYDPNASHNNDTDNRWIGSENEVTKPGSYDSINATEIVDGSGVSGTVKVIVPSSYEYTHIYYWNCNNSSYTSSWPGLKMPHNGSNYEFIFENTSKVNIIFNKGGNGQTGDLSIGSSGTYKFNGSSLTKQ